MVRTTPLLVGALIVVAGLVATRTPVPSAPRVTEDGTAFEDLISTSDTSIVVVYDPALCFQCDVFMPQLQEWGAARAGRFALVLTRPVTDDERDKMALLRINPRGVVGARPSLVTGRRFKAEILLYVNGVEVLTEPYDPSLDAAGSSPVVDYVLQGAE